MAEKTGGLSAEEREAVKQRNKELREQEKAGKNRDAGAKANAEAIAKLTDEDQRIANGFVKVVGEVAPDLFPKTYYGMPGFANDDGKIVVLVQPGSKFKTRYSTLGFEQPANLDDGEMWPTAFAVLTWNAAIEKKVAALVKTATS